MEYKEKGCEQTKYEQTESGLYIPTKEIITLDGLRDKLIIVPEEDLQSELEKLL